MNITEQVEDAPAAETTDAYRRRAIARELDRLAAGERAARQLAQRRKLLWTLPLGIAAIQGCGGGGNAVAATAAAPAPAPVPEATAPPAAAPAPAPAPAPASSSVGITAVASWSVRPAATAALGQAIIVRDVGPNGSLWVSDGSVWLPASNPLMLAHKFSNAKMDASVGVMVDVLLDSFIIPAYVLGPASGLRITAAYSFPGGGTAGKAPQVRAYFGTSTYAASGTTLFDARGQFTTQKSVLLNLTLQNRNSLASNDIRPSDYDFGASINAFATASIDFSQDVTIGFGALNNSSSLSSDDQQWLDWFSVELIA